MMRIQMEGMPPDKIMKALLLLDDGVEAALEGSAGIAAQILPYQAAALCILARQYDREGARLLDIGTAAGYSASVMAQAAPGAEVVTLNPAAHEVEAARRNLERWANARVVRAASWDYLADYRDPHLDMVFVDADHKRVAEDVPWWRWLTEGGLMLFHDYSAEACPPVREAVDGMAEALGRGPDILIVDDGGIGMAGFYKRR
jgi:predicted O-methyltransferase YrrM